MSGTTSFKATLEIQKTVEVELRKNESGMWDWRSGDDESDIYFPTLEEAVENARKKA